MPHLYQGECQEPEEFDAGLIEAELIEAELIEADRVYFDVMASR